MSDISSVHSKFLEALEAVLPGINLFAIDPSKTHKPVSYAAPSVAAAVEWSAQMNAAGWNIYHHMHVGEGATRRLQKHMVTHLRVLHADVDPPKGMKPWHVEPQPYTDWFNGTLEELQRLGASKIIFSGRGIQGFWMLPQALPNIPLNLHRIESVNFGLLHHLRTESGTQDITRVMKLPGLVAYPNTDKVASGWQPQAVAVLPGGTGRAISQEELSGLIGLVPKNRIEAQAVNAEPTQENPLGLPVAVTVDISKPLTDEQKELVRKIIKKLKGGKNWRWIEQGIPSREHRQANTVFWNILNASVEITHDIQVVGFFLLNSGFARNSYQPSRGGTRMAKCEQQLASRWPGLVAKHSQKQQQLRSMVNGILERNQK